MSYDPSRHCDYHPSENLRVRIFGSQNDFECVSVHSLHASFGLSETFALPDMKSPCVLTTGEWKVPSFTGTLEASCH